MATSNKLFSFFKFNNEMCKINTLRPQSSLSCSGIGFPDYNYDKFINVKSPFLKKINSSPEAGTSKIPTGAAADNIPTGAAADNIPTGATADNIPTGAAADNIPTVEAIAVEYATVAETVAETVEGVNILKKYKKKKITPTIKKHIWNTYIGHDILKHKCFCCKKTTIQINEFEAGHVLSEANGGTCEMSNFRPICRNCNLSMGSMHMEDYVKKYGLYI